MYRRRCCRWQRYCRTVKEQDTLTRVTISLDLRDAGSKVIDHCNDVSPPTPPASQPSALLGAGRVERCGNGPWRWGTGTHRPLQRCTVTTVAAIVIVTVGVAVMRRTERSLQWCNGTWRWWTRTHRPLWRSIAMVSCPTAASLAKHACTHEMN